MVPLLLSAPWWVRLPKKLVQTSWWGGLVPAHWWVELGIVILVGRAMSRDVFIGGCGLMKTLSSLSAVGRGCVPALLFVGCLRHPSTGAFGLSGRARSWHQNGGLQANEYSPVPPPPLSLSLQ